MEATATNLSKQQKCFILELSNGDDLRSDFFLVQLQTERAEIKINM